MFHDFAVYLRQHETSSCIETIECTFFQLPVVKILRGKHKKNTSQIKLKFITQQFVYSAIRSSFPIFNLEIPHEQENSALLCHTT